MLAQLVPGCRLNAGGGFHTRDHFSQISIRQVASTEGYSGDFLRVGDVSKRVGIEQDEVSEFAGFNGAELRLEAGELCGIERGGLQSFERGKAGRHEALQFFVQTE